MFGWVFLLVWVVLGREAVAVRCLVGPLLAGSPRLRMGDPPSKVSAVTSVAGWDDRRWTGEGEADGWS